MWVFPFFTDNVDNFMIYKNVLTEADMIYIPFKIVKCVVCWDK